MTLRQDAALEARRPWLGGRLCGAALVVVMASSGMPHASTASADVLNAWNARLLQTIRDNGDFEAASPGAVSRYSALMYLAMYDAVNSIARTHEPYLDFYPCPAEISMEAAISAAGHKVLCDLFPTAHEIPLFDAVHQGQLNQIPDGPAKTAGVKLGVQAAIALLDHRANDGSTDYVTYVPNPAPGFWKPTFPDFTGAWGPHWGFVTPWCLKSPDQFRPATGPWGYNDMESLLASPEWAADYNEVLQDGAIFSATRTEDETLAALYWANDRNGTFKPPGHLLHITEEIAKVMGSSLEDRIRLFALVSLAMADAGVASWDAKYNTKIDLWRPITAIWEGDTDGNPATIGDPSWLGLSYDPSILIFTPPFPAWVSGHATFGAAHAEIVRHFYGTDAITFSATSDDTPGYWRTFTSLDQAARENGHSRIWLGVHYRVDVEDGYDLGTAVSAYINANFLRTLGDLNGDGLVDGADLGILLGAWDSTDSAADLNRDGIVDGADLGLLLGLWS